MPGQSDDQVGMDHIHIHQVGATVYISSKNGDFSGSSCDFSRDTKAIRRVSRKTTFPGYLGFLVRGHGIRNSMDYLFGSGFRCSWLNDGSLIIHSFAVEPSTFLSKAALFLTHLLQKCHLS